MPSFVFKIQHYFAVVFLVLCNVSGSKIKITASTPSIQPLLNTNLTLQCSLVDTASSSSVIGKRNDKIEISPDRRDVSFTPDNAKYVTSIFLFQNNEDIAGVTEHIPVHTMGSGNVSNINVSGGIPGSQGDKGFLAMTVSYPTNQHDGNYTCVIAAIDDVGHSVAYSSSVYIDVTTPTISDLVQHIYAQDLENKATIEQLQLKDQQQEAEIAKLKSELDIARHLESGTVSFGKLGSVNGGLSSRSINVKFAKPYSQTPSVHLALLDSGAWTRWAENYSVKLTSVDVNGFTVEVSLKYDDHYISYMHVSWLSHP